MVWIEPSTKFEPSAVNFTSSLCMEILHVFVERLRFIEWIMFSTSIKLCSLVRWNDMELLSTTHSHSCNLLQIWLNNFESNFAIRNSSVIFSTSTVTMTVSNHNNQEINLNCCCILINIDYIILIKIFTISPQSLCIQ